MQHLCGQIHAPKKMSQSLCSRFHAQGVATPLRSFSCAGLKINEKQQKPMQNNEKQASALKSNQKQSMANLRHTVCTSMETNEKPLESIKVDAHRWTWKQNCKKQEPSIRITGSLLLFESHLNRAQVL